MKGLPSNAPLLRQILCPFVDFGLLHKEEYQSTYSRTEQAYQRILRRAQQREFPFLEQPFSPKLQGIGEWAQHFQKFSMILVIDTHGSALDMRVLTGLLQSSVWVQGSFPRLCFLDTLDPEKFWETMSVAHPKTTGIVVFSSPKEREATVLSLMRCLEYWQGLLPVEELPYHVLVVHGGQAPLLEKICRQFSLSSLQQEEVRDSPVCCFRPTSLLPAMIIGFEAEKFYQGAALTCNRFFSQHMKTPLEFVALAAGLAQKKALRHHLLFPQGDLLKLVTKWYQKVWCQWAASWGDCLLPLLPLPSMEEDDKPSGTPPPFSTLFFESHMTKERLEPSTWRSIPEVHKLAHQSLESMLQKNFKAFFQRLQHHHRPFRILQVDRFNEETLGALLMSFVLELLLLQELSAPGGA